MDAEKIKKALQAAGDLLVIAYNEANGTSAAALPSAPTLAETASVSGFLADGKFIKDFWARGQMGAQKGASQAMYSTAWQVLTMMGCPNIETYVCVPGEENYNDFKRAWDLGWMPAPPDAGQPPDPLWAHLYDKRG